MKKSFIRRDTALRHIRLRTGKTQAIVADELGLSKSTYSAWETGRISLNTEHILMLSDYFGCTPNDIVGYTGCENAESTVASMSNLSEDERDLLTLFEFLPPNNRKSVLDLMRSCTKRQRPRA